MGMGASVTPEAATLAPRVRAFSSHLLKPAPGHLKSVLLLLPPPDRRGAAGISSWLTLQVAFAATIFTGFAKFFSVMRDNTIGEGKIGTVG